MEVIILAGGLGTRLKGVIDDIPKPMAPVNGKPFLEVLLNNLNKQSFKSVTLSVGYKWEVIKDYFGEKYKDIDIKYSIEKDPLGTGGGISQAMNNTHSSNYLILNGDTLFDIDFTDFKNFHLSNNSDISLALKNMHKPYRYGTVELNLNRITQFVEKREIDDGLINCGVYIINNKIKKEFPRGRFSFEKFMENNTKKLILNGKIYSDYFIDIGIPEDYAKIQDDLK